MNLSRVKIVATIADFNPKMGYPEFGNHTVVTKEPTVIAPVVVKEPKIVPKWRRRQIKDLKKAMKSFKSRVGIGYKPVLLTSNKLV